MADPDVRPPSKTRSPWSSPTEVLAKLRRRWNSGEFLSAYANGKLWEPIPIGLRGPSSSELGSNFGAAQDWVRLWERSAHRHSIRIEYVSIGGRTVGANQVPRQVWIDSYANLWRLLQVKQEVHRFEHVVDGTRHGAPRLLDWVIAHPMKVLGIGDDWERIAATVIWIDDKSVQGMYLRQVDVPGVDTKFIEGYRSLLAELLDQQLPLDRVDPLVPRANFEGRYGFQTKPDYVRFRSLSDRDDPDEAFSELTVRAAELAMGPRSESTVFIVENEITYLALPSVPDAIAIFGGGYAVSVLKLLPWLRDRKLVYWGDLDTHGFAILNQVRSHHPHAKSLLMDRATLLEHESQWVREPTPTNAHLNHLTPDEEELYRDLVEDMYQPSLRLEQERIGYGAIQRAIKSSVDSSLR